MNQYKIKSKLSNGYVGHFEVFGKNKEEALSVADLCLRPGEVILDIIVIASLPYTFD